MVHDGPRLVRESMEQAGEIFTQGHSGYSSVAASVIGAEIKGRQRAAGLPHNPRPE